MWGSVSETQGADATSSTRKGASAASPGSVRRRRLVFLKREWNKVAVCCVVLPTLLLLVLMIRGCIVDIHLGTERVKYKLEQMLEDY